MLIYRSSRIGTGVYRTNTLVLIKKYLNWIRRYLLLKIRKSLNSLKKKERLLNYKSLRITDMEGSSILL